MRKILFILFSLSSVSPSLAGTYIVDPNGFKDFTKIQDAINASWHGDTVIVNPGMYDNIYFNGRAITLTSIEPNDPNIVSSTIINVSSGYSITFDFAEDYDSVLIGFTVQGTILCYDSSPTIKKNIIRASSSYGIVGQYGASPIILNNTINSNGSRGICGCDGPITSNLISENIGGLYQCNGEIIENIIIDNEVPAGGNSYGGGLYQCNGIIYNNIISGNSNISTTYNSSYGGGLYQCNGTIANNTISGNSAISSGSGGSYGGGLYQCNGIIYNNIISGNSATSAGAGHYGGGLYGCNGTINNNTISGNSVIGAYGNGYGGGLYGCNNSVHNNIIAFNKANTTGGIYGSCSNSYNNLWMNEGGNWGGGATAGTGDICVNPLFAINGYRSGDTWIDGDYHLKSEAGRWDPNSKTWIIDNVTSFCIDAGDPCDPIEYEPNPNGGRINMGAYGGTIEASKSTGGPGPEPNPYCKEKIPGDVNNDCKVDFTDFAIMSSHWLECNLDPPSACW